MWDPQVSQPYGPPWPVTGIALPFYSDMIHFPIYYLYKIKGKLQSKSVSIYFPSKLRATEAMTRCIHCISNLALNDTRELCSINFIGRRKLHNEEVHSLQYSLNIVQVIKSRNMNWSEHRRRMGKREIHSKLWSEILKGNDHLEHTGAMGG
jgi:hypothetical protein